MEFVQIPPSSKPTLAAKSRAKKLLSALSIAVWGAITAVGCYAAWCHYQYDSVYKQAAATGGYSLEPSTSMATDTVEAVKCGLSGPVDPECLKAILSKTTSPTLTTVLVFVAARYLTEHEDTIGLRDLALVKLDEAEKSLAQLAPVVAAWERVDLLLRVHPVLGWSHQPVEAEWRFANMFSQLLLARASITQPDFFKHQRDARNVLRDQLGPALERAGVTPH